MLTGLAVGRQRLVEALQPLRDRFGHVLQPGDHARHRRHQLGVVCDARAHPLQALRALGPLALHALEHPALRGQLRRQLGTPIETIPPHPVIGRGAAALDERADPPLLLTPLVQGADGGAMGVGQPVARRIGLRHSGGGPLDAGAGVDLGLGGAL